MCWWGGAKTYEIWVKRVETEWKACPIESDGHSSANDTYEHASNVNGVQIYQDFMFHVNVSFYERYESYESKPNEKHVRLSRMVIPVPIIRTSMHQMSMVCKYIRISWFMSMFHFCGLGCEHLWHVTFSCVWGCGSWWMGCCRVFAAWLDALVDLWEEWTRNEWFLYSCFISVC
jgi:hypothetical protein